MAEQGCEMETNFVYIGHENLGNDPLFLPYPASSGTFPPPDPVQVNPFLTKAVKY